MMSSHMDRKMLKSRLLSLMALVFAMGGLVSCSKQVQAVDPAVIVPVAKATRANLSNELVLTAEFIPYQDVEVMAKVAGYVRAIRVDMGDHVHQGELLATLEDPELQNEMAKAAAAAKAAQSDVVSAQNELTRAKAAYEIAHLSYTRIQDVSKKEVGLVPQQDVDVAYSHDLEAQAQLSTAQSSLQSAEEHSSEALAEQDRLKTMYQYTDITAPFMGVVTKRYANTGSMIQAGISSQTQSMPVVRLAQDDLLRLILPVPVTAVPGIHVGQIVDVNVITLGKTFPGKVTRFADNIQTSTRTMDTEVDVPNPKLTIVPGMYAEVHLHLEDRNGVVSLPLDAVDGLGSESEHVYQVGSDREIHIVPVTTGIETPNRVEILSGVRAGDTFVVGRHTGMTEGEKVQPQQAEYDADNGAGKQEN
jgi:RND family efflux transporter MFP subunit